MDLEANPEETVSEAMQEEVPKEEVTMKPVRALKKWHGDRYLAVGRRRNGPRAIVGPGKSLPPPTEG
jgi:hypothetical protein